MHLVTPKIKGLMINIHLIFLVFYFYICNNCKMNTVAVMQFVKVPDVCNGGTINSE
jgi:hypothetical protein